MSVQISRIFSILLFVFSAITSFANSQAQTFSATSTPLIVARTGHQITPLPNGEALVTGGFDGATLITGPDSAEIYNPSLGANGSFTPAINGLNTPRAGHAAVVLNNGQILIAGGEDKNYNPLDNAELFNPVNGTFTTLTRGC